ncbi:MAG: FAD-dependent 5-carboxymethylaminomethyl-2-thiouridine(34) oxidoreductase MnmC, partial [Gammaproteobacteria bacterium]|nr:FAD-dependent 5-carboxymethylaminomethyl-2-thiouridine(34) oxidoreductase MnmC [Gammaproteobacteria bacterium]
LPQTSFLPLQPVRGQLTTAAQNSASSKLRRVVVAGKYICPADAGFHSIGASYKNLSTDTSTRAEEDLENLQGISGAFSQQEDLGLTAHDARAAVRCNAADYFPVVGAVPDYQDFIEVFAELKRNADASIEVPARHQPGLYVNTAHGSYGLASCPLAAEYLSSLINDENLPLTNPVADSLNPARFIIRELKKQNVGADE